LLLLLLLVLLLLLLVLLLLLFLLLLLLFVVVVAVMMMVAVRTPARLPTEQSEAQIYTDKQQRTATTYRWHTDNTEPESLSPSRFKSQEASSVAQKASAPA